MSGILGELYDATSSMCACKIAALQSLQACIRSMLKGSWSHLCCVATPWVRLRHGKTAAHFPVAHSIGMHGHVHNPLHVCRGDVQCALAWWLEKWQSNCPVFDKADAG